MLPSGRHAPSEAGTQLTSGVPFGRTKLDDVFDSRFDAPAGREEVCTSTLVDPANRRKLTVRYGGLFRHCVVFNPPHREAICIEPYTTVPDAFALLARGVSPHLLSLAPSGSLETWFDVRVAEGSS